MNRLGPLRHRAYRRVWLGRATSSFGDRLIFIAFAFWKPRRPLLVGNSGLVVAAAPLLLLAKPTGTWPIAVALFGSSVGLALLRPRSDSGRR